MKIEIKGENKDLKVLDYVVRDIDWDIDGEKPIKKPHFQAKIQLADGASDSNYNCDISYYNQNNEFIGLDEVCYHLQGNKQNMPSSLSTELNIPESAYKMVVTFTSEKENNVLYVATGIAVVSVLIILGAWAIKSVLSVFA